MANFGWKKEQKLNNNNGSCILVLNTFKLGIDR